MTEAPGPLRVALLGAESTGKTTLAQDLGARCAALGRPVAVVDEHLRAWVDAHGRTPRPHEQAAIAAEQQRRVDEAAATLPPHGLVLADTTALMTAVYSALLFDDHSLLPQALRWQRGYHLNLLLALDLPWVADGLQRDGPHVRAPVDERLRAALSGAGLRWSVIAGQGERRLQQAESAIAFAATRADPETPSGDSAPDLAGHGAHAPAAMEAGAGTPDAAPIPRWRSVCACCGDPDCERRLFRS